MTSLQRRLNDAAQLRLLFQGHNSRAKTISVAEKFRKKETIFVEVFATIETARFRPDSGLSSLIQPLYVWAYTARVWRRCALWDRECTAIGGDIVCVFMWLNSELYLFVRMLCMMDYCCLSCPYVCPSRTPVLSAHPLPVWIPECRRV